MESMIAQRGKEKASGENRSADGDDDAACYVPGTRRGTRRTRVRQRGFLRAMDRREERLSSHSAAAGREMTGLSGGEARGKKASNLKRRATRSFAGARRKDVGADFRGNDSGERDAGDVFTIFARQKI